MKTRIFLNIILLLTFSVSIHAQTQCGIVKTKGRLDNNGKVIKGTPLQNVTVMVKGRNQFVSDSHGMFCFPLPGQNYYLLNVKKLGYVLTDPDILSKPYSYSKDNPLYIVMETPDTQTADKLATERKIRRTLQKKLQQREDEIRRLKEENKISQQEYQQMLQKLFSSQETNEKLISEMAERYSKMDYDQVDELNRRISELILNGELTRADSLIKSKGDVHTRRAALKHHQDANAKEEIELAQRQENLSRSKAYVQKELEDLAQDCRHKYEIFRMNFQNDSAAYYLEIRANLDTMNVDWQNEIGLFLLEYLARNNNALTYFQRALRNGVSQYGEKHPKVATAYNNIGMIFHGQKNYPKALEYYHKALDIRLPILGEKHPNVANSYNNLGCTYQDYGDDTKDFSSLQKAFEYFQKALGIQLSVLGEKHLDVATSYNNIGGILNSQGNYSKALEYFQKALDIRLLVLGEKHPNVATSYNNMGMAICNQGDYAKGLEYYQKALSIRVTVLDKNHPHVAQSYNNIGMTYHNLGDHTKALEYFQKVLDIQLPVLGKNHLKVANCYSDIGVEYHYLANYPKALEYYNKALDIRRTYLNENHPDIVKVKEYIELIRE